MTRQRKSSQREIVSSKWIKEIEQSTKHSVKYSTMNYRFLCYLFVVFVTGECCLNSIPSDSIVLTTNRSIYSVRPAEKNGHDKINLIFESNKNSTILRSIFDSTRNELEIFQINDLTKEIHVDHIENVEKSFPFRKKLKFPPKSVDFRRFGLFNGEKENPKFFSVDFSGNLNFFSSDGSILSRIVLSSKIAENVESVTFHGMSQRFFFVTSTTVFSCRIVDTKDVDCCSKIFPQRKFRHGSFNKGSDESFFYVFDLETGIYRVNLSQSFCPTDFHLTKSLDERFHRNFKIERDFFVFSTLKRENGSKSSIFVGFLTGKSRPIEFNETIVDLDFNFEIENEKQIVRSNVPNETNNFTVFFLDFLWFFDIFQRFSLDEIDFRATIQEKEVFHRKR